MIVSDHRRALILIALYGAILAGWFSFARWVASPIIASTNSGRSSAVLNRLVQDTRSAAPLATTVLEHWRHFSGAVLLAGLLHLAIVLWIRLHDPARAGRGSSPRRRLERWANPVLILLSFAFLALTVQRGGIQDYYFYLQMWREVWLGHDPWFFAYGVFGKYPMNAYGPLFNVFAIPEFVNPLLPKLLFAGAYLAFAVWLIKDRGKDWPQAGLVWPLLLVWFWMPYCWVEIANFGHFDVLVGLLCAGRGRGPGPSARRDLRCLPGSGRVAQVHADCTAAFFDPGSRAAPVPLVERRSGYDRLGAGCKRAPLGAFDLPPADLRSGTVVASSIDLPVSQGALLTAAMARFP